MTTPSHLGLMSRYNGWANETLLTACQGLTDEEYRKDLGAFFTSVEGTLNHILLVDRMWLDRLRGEVSPYTALDLVLYGDRAEFLRQRRREDSGIETTVRSLTQEDLNRLVCYRTLSGGGMEMQTPAGLILTHLFNHATHHRGQIHGMLSQLGSAPPPLDLIFYLRDHPDSAASA